MLHRPGDLNCYDYASIKNRIYVRMTLSTRNYLANDLLTFPFVQRRSLRTVGQKFGIIYFVESKSLMVRVRVIK